MDKDSLKLFSDDEVNHIVVNPVFLTVFFMATLKEDRYSQHVMGKELALENIKKIRKMTTEYTKYFQKMKGKEPIII